MKKIISLLLVLVFLCLSACGSKPPANTASPASDPVSTAAPTPPPPTESPDIAVTVVEEEGRIMAESASKMAASYTISSEWIPFEYSYVIERSSGSDVVAFEDSIYVLTEGVLSEFAIMDGILVYVQDHHFDGTSGSFYYRSVCDDANGVMYFSDLGMDFIGYKNGSLTFVNTPMKNVAISPDGTIGVSYFLEEANKIFLDDGIMQTEPWDFEELKSIHNINISDNYIFACGNSIENENAAIFLYDWDYNLVMTLGDKAFGEPDNLSTISEVVETENGFMALDRTWNGLYFWKPDGTFISKISTRDLFPDLRVKLRSADVMTDGSIIIGTTVENENILTDEVILYRLTGF